MADTQLLGKAGMVFVQHLPVKAQTNLYRFIAFSRIVSMFSWFSWFSWFHA
jgi:hypothetical protein